MSSSWSSPIDRFNRNLERLKTVPEQVLTLVADTVKDDLQQSYALQQNPYGAPWQARQVNKPWNILDATGELKASLRTDVINNNRLVVGYDDFKAKFHNDGTRFLPVRRLVPYANRLPQRWVTAIQQAFSKTVRELFGK